MNTVKSYSSKIVNFLFCFFPVSFILGNQAININILAIIVSTFFFYSKQIFKINLNTFDKILLLFFFYTLITLTINYFEYYSIDETFPKIIIFKTIFFFKYLLLYFSIRIFTNQQIINIKTFNFICASCASLVIFDVFFQFLFGKNILGLVPFSTRHYSSFFGQELIAGGYLQKFSMFIFFLPIIFKNSHSNKIIIQLFLFIIISFAMILTGNRMPFLLFLFSVFIYLCLNLKSIKIIVSFFITILTLSTLSFYKIPSFQVNMINFLTNSKVLVSAFFNKNLILDPYSPVWQRPYVSEFHCAKEAIKLNPVFGGGLRSYRTLFPNCNTHPHNYYFEIISDLGIVGLIIITFFAYKLLFKIFRHSQNSNNKIRTNFEAIFPFVLIFLIEFFPFRTSGSFFTTNNATIIFIVSAVLVSYYDQLNKKI